MSKADVTEITNSIYYPLIGTITAGGIGAVVFEVLGAVVLGIIGAITGWVAKRFIIPYLDKKFPPPPPPTQK